MYFHKILYLNTFVVLVIGQSLNCGSSGKSISLVINGTLSERGAWPWIVSLYDFKTNQLFCGGTLIDDKTVITAAHCIQDKGQQTPRSAIDIIIKLGRYDLSQRYERGGIDAYPLDIFIHPNWKIHTQDYDSDIAVIKLSTPVVFNGVIQPICMWKSNESPIVNTGYIVGYGKSENDALHEWIPRELDVRIKTNEECFLHSPRFTYISSSNTFCAGRDEYSSACRGDSGNGLFIEVNGHWYLRGIISASFFSKNNLCDTSADTVFTNVLKFLNWINEKILISTQQPQQQVFLNHQQVVHEKEIVCYIANWAIYREKGGKFTIDNFKPELCTTAIYHFAGLDDDGKLKSLDPWADLSDNGGLNGYKRFTALKTSYPHLRLLLSVGGWNEGVEKYSNLAANSVKRSEFAIQSAQFLMQYGFDGLNFFWDYPGDHERGGIPADKQNYPLLLKEIHKVYRPRNLYLSASLRSSEWVIKLGLDLEEISKYVDAVNMISFDYAGAWDRRIGFPAPMKTSLQYNNIESAVKIFLESNVPKNKIILGIPFYARTFKTSNDGNIGDECDRQGFAGPIIQSDVLVGFNELCELRGKKSWLYRFDKNASQMIAKFIENQKVNVAVYDSPRSVANKVKYAMEKNLLGIWAWSIDTDDFLGNCMIDTTTYDDFGIHKPDIISQRDFPLLRTINNVVKIFKKKSSF